MTLNRPQDPGFWLGLSIGMVAAVILCLIIGLGSTHGLRAEVSIMKVDVAVLKEQLAAAQKTILECIVTLVQAHESITDCVARNETMLNRLPVR